MSYKLNHRVRVQLKEQKRLERMVQHGTDDMDDIKIGIQIYIKKYGVDMFVEDLSTTYQQKLRSMLE